MATARKPRKDDDALPAPELKGATGPGTGADDVDRTIPAVRVASAPGESALAANGFALARMESAEIIDIIRENAGAAGLSQADLERVTVPGAGGVNWEVQTLQGPAAVPELVGVMLAFHDQRAYWSVPFDQRQGEVSPPDCVSHDMLTGVGDPGGECAACPLSRFGTARDGKGLGQACREMRLIYLLQPTDVLPVVISAPPSSLKAVKSFFNRASRSTLRFHELVVALRLIRDRSQGGVVYSYIQPEGRGTLSQDDRERIRPLRELVARATRGVSAVDYRNR
jgi:hypothetical protein